MCKRMENRLKITCLGLVELTPATSETYYHLSTRRVQFMHQSVADFLATPEAQEHIRSRLRDEPSFSPWPHLMQGDILSLKCLSGDMPPDAAGRTRLADEWYTNSWKYIASFAKYAAIQERHQGKAPCELVEQMDREAAKTAKYRLQHDRWQDNMPLHVHWSGMRRGRDQTGLVRQ